MKSDTLENSMFTIITDMDGKVLSEEELKKMQLEGLIRLLHEKIKRMDYLHEDDRRMLLYLARAINEKIEF